MSEGQVSSSPVSYCHETLDHLYALTRVYWGTWEFCQPVSMCFVDLECSLRHPVECIVSVGLGV